MGCEHANGLYCSLQLTTPLSRHSISLEPLDMLMIWACPSVHSNVPHMHSLREHSLQLGIQYDPAHRWRNLQVCNRHGALCLGYRHNAARKQSVIHSSICTMGTQNLLDLNTMIHLPPTTPLLAGGDRRGPKSLVHVSWYGLLHVFAEGNNTHFHCSTVMMLSAYKVYPVSSMLPSLTAWFSRTRSNAARSAASSCRTSQLFIEVLANSSGCVRSRIRRSRGMAVGVECKYK
jgi:hypothetical protein